MQTLRAQPVEQLRDASWFPFSDEPILSGSWYVPRLSCPVCLFPEDASDGKWHLFAHSWLGIHHYVSGSGIVWEPIGMIQMRGTAPFLFKEKGMFHLIYERHGKALPFVEHLSRGNRKRQLASSHIEMRSSNDLAVWSEPRILLDSKDIPPASDYVVKPILSHPQLVAADGGYRLYVGSSAVQESESFARYVCTAFSASLEGPYEPEQPIPLLEPVPNDPWRSLGCGRVSVVKGNQGYGALQTSLYWDAGRKRAASAIVLLVSPDGLSWTRMEGPPVLVPAGHGWASAFITACNIHYKQEEDCWYCYFSACGERRFGMMRESIGLLIGKDPTLRKPIDSSREMFPSD